MGCWEESPRCLWGSWVHNPLRRPPLWHLFVIILEEPTCRGFPSSNQKGGGRQTEQRTGRSLWTKVSVESQKPPRLLASIWETGRHGWEGQDASFILPVKVFSVFNALLTKSFKQKNRQVWCGKPDVLFSANECENQQRPWKRHFCLFLVSPADRHSWPLESPVPSYHRLLSLMQTEKDGKTECAGSNLVTPHNLSKRGEEISWKLFPPPSWVTPNSFKFLLPLVCGNNLRVILL